MTKKKYNKKFNFDDIPILDIKYSGANNIELPRATLYSPTTEYYTLVGITIALKVMKSLLKHNDIRFRESEFWKEYDNLKSEGKIK